LTNRLGQTSVLGTGADLFKKQKRPGTSRGAWMYFKSSRNSLKCHVKLDANDEHMGNFQSAQSKAREGEEPLLHSGKRTVASTAVFQSLQIPP